MPTYEYVCNSCQNHWEEIQKISEPALEVCPKCTQNTAKRQISGGRFILKGGGWYADLYSSSKPGKGSSNSSSNTASDSKSETKSETKSESSTSTSKDSAGSSGSSSSSATTPASSPPASKS